MTGSARIPKIRMLASVGMTDAEIGRQLGISSRTVARDRETNGIAPGYALREREERHGTLGEYHRGCRCDACRMANTEAGRRGRADRQERIPGPEDPRHGGARFATNWTCHCEPCRAAVSEENAKRERVRTRMRRMNQQGGAGLHWTPAEDRVVLDNAPAVAAKLIGRTVSAVYQRQYNLRRKVETS